MKANIASDLHFEFHRDGGRSMIASLADADILVCAGDLSNAYGVVDGLRLLYGKYPEVVFVCGNHEFYGGQIGKIQNLIDNLSRELGNLHHLNNSTCEIDRHKFVGTTLWFRRTPGIENYQHMMNDFFQISNPQDMYYENSRALEFLDREVSPGSIVVTHHLPSQKCVHPKYAASPINPFFVCDVEEMIWEREPRFWIHGHTHESMNLRIGRTQTICNPFGYSTHEINPLFREDLIIEI